MEIGARAVNIMSSERSKFGKQNDIRVLKQACGSKGMSIKE